MLWQWIQNNFGIIIIAVSFGISGLGWLLQQLKAAQEKKKADQARQKAKMEALRTGRVEAPQAPPVPMAAQQRTPQRGAQQQQGTPRDRLEELARRRQQEQQQRAASKRQDLEEQLRRRREAIEAQRRRQQDQQQQRQQHQQPTQRPSQQAQRPQQQAQRPQQRTQAQRPSTRQPQRDRPRPIPATRPADPTQAPVQQTVITDVIEAKRRNEERPVEAPIAVGGRRRAAALTARGIDIRQAILMREIFDRPIGFRQPGDQQF